MFVIPILQMLWKPDHTAKVQLLLSSFFFPVPPPLLYLPTFMGPKLRAPGAPPLKNRCWLDVFIHLGLKRLEHPTVAAKTDVLRSCRNTTTSWCSAHLNPPWWFRWDLFCWKTSRQQMKDGWCRCFLVERKNRCHGSWWFMMVLHGSWWFIKVHHVSSWFTFLGLEGLLFGSLSPITGFQQKPAKDCTAPSAASSGALNFNDTQQRSATCVDIDTSPRDTHSGHNDDEVGSRDKVYG